LDAFIQPHYGILFIYIVEEVPPYVNQSQQFGLFIAFLRHDADKAEHFIPAIFDLVGGPSWNIAERTRPQLIGLSEVYAKEFGTVLTSIVV
jgi:hypothetical protein